MAGVQKDVAIQLRLTPDAKNANVAKQTAQQIESIRGRSIENLLQMGAKQLEMERRQLEQHSTRVKATEAKTFAELKKFRDRAAAEAARARQDELQALKKHLAAKRRLLQAQAELNRKSRSGTATDADTSNVVAAAFEVDSTGLVANEYAELRKEAEKTLTEVTKMHDDVAKNRIRLVSEIAKQEQKAADDRLKEIRKSETAFIKTMAAKKRAIADAERAQMAGISALKTSMSEFSTGVRQVARGIALMGAFAEEDLEMMARKLAKVEAIFSLIHGGTTAVLAMKRGYEALRTAILGAAAAQQLLNTAQLAGGKGGKNKGGGGGGTGIAGFVAMMAGQAIGAAGFRGIGGNIGKMFGGKAAAGSLGAFSKFMAGGGAKAAAGGIGMGMAGAGMTALAALAAANQGARFFSGGESLLDIFNEKRAIDAQNAQFPGMFQGRAEGHFQRRLGSIESQRQIDRMRVMGTGSRADLQRNRIDRRAALDSINATQNRMRTSELGENGENAIRLGQQQVEQMQRLAQLDAERAQIRRKMLEDQREIVQEAKKELEHARERVAAAKDAVGDEFASFGQLSKGRQDQVKGALKKFADGGIGALDKFDVRTLQRFGGQAGADIANQFFRDKGAKDGGAELQQLFGNLKARGVGPQGELGEAQSEAAQAAANLQKAQREASKLHAQYVTAQQVAQEQVEKLDKIVQSVTALIDAADDEGAQASEVFTGLIQQVSKLDSTIIKVVNSLEEKVEEVNQKNENRMVNAGRAWQGMGSIPR